MMRISRGLVDRAFFCPGPFNWCPDYAEHVSWRRYLLAKEIMSLVGKLRPGATRERHTVRALRLLNKSRSEYAAVVKRIKGLASEIY